MRIPDVGTPLGEPEITTPREPEIVSPDSNPRPHQDPKPERKKDRTHS